MSAFDFHALDHETFMRQALHEAELAIQDGERPIGAVVVHQGQVVGRGHARHLTRQSKLAHAEMNALSNAEQYIFAHQHENIVLYTTVEPCVMCLGTIVMSDIDHVVYALADRWIKPDLMLQIPYVRRHIHNYLGGVLEAESVALWARSRPEELVLIQNGG